MNRQLNLLNLELVVLLFLSGCVGNRQISYQADVYPIIKDKCLACHTPPQGDGYKKGGLDMTGYSALKKGSFYGTIIKPGDSQHSSLNMLVEGRADNCTQMLHKDSDRLTQQEIDSFRYWVDQGAKNN